jgi:hypothetical protein
MLRGQKLQNAADMKNTVNNAIRVRSLLCEAPEEPVPGNRDLTLISRSILTHTYVIAR